MTDREAFEAWIRQNKPGLSLVKFGGVTYCDWNTEDAWTEWQASCKYKDDLIHKDRTKRDAQAAESFNILLNGKRA